jgi:Protein of unknown function (DUF2752)
MSCLLRTGRPSTHALGLAIAGASLLVAAAVFPLDAPPLSLFGCPLRAATGMPCLTCGCTHAFAAFARLHFVEAAGANPLGAALALACAVHAVWTALRLCGLRYVPAPFAVSPRMRLCVAVALAANWAFLIVHGAP